MFSDMATPFVAALMVAALISDLPSALFTPTICLVAFAITLYQRVDTHSQPASICSDSSEARPALPTLPHSDTADHASISGGQVPASRPQAEPVR